MQPLFSYAYIILPRYKYLGGVSQYVGQSYIQNAVYIKSGCVSETVQIR